MRPYTRKPNGDWTLRRPAATLPPMQAEPLFPQPLFPRPLFPRPLFHRLDERARPALRLTVDGAPITALAGDTLLTALLTAGARLRDSEFGDGPRAGFCLMGACQDCWVWTVSGERLRACSTEAAEGMSILTTSPPPSLPCPPQP